MKSITISLQALQHSASPSGSNNAEDSSLCCNSSAQTARQFSLIAPAKINLALHVVGQRGDGYHLLETLVTFLRYGDQLSARITPCDQIIIDGRYGSDLGMDADNLIVKARDVLRQHMGCKTTPVSLHLTKKLPPGSGLGGGSSDAAATLLALAQLWQLEIEIAQLAQIAISIGADVPMCLYAIKQRGALIARGIGDDIKPLPAFPALDMVLITPPYPLSTAHVFSQLKNKNNPPLTCDITSLTTKEQLIAVLRQNRNDLYQPARQILPELDTMLTQLTESGALFSRMSGSGASCFGIYENQHQAQAAARLLLAQHPDYFVIAGRSGQCAPRIESFPL